MSGLRLVDGPGEPRETAPVLEALLGTGLLVEVPAGGDSMRPTLLAGDRLVVAPFLGLPRPGQIVVARAAAGLVAHRLAFVETRDGRRLYRLQGDAASALDAALQREDLMGRVVEVVRDGVRRPVDESPRALRLATLRLALRRRRPRLVRAAAAFLAALAAGLGTVRGAPTFAPPETTYAPAPDYKFAPGDVLSLRIWDGEKLDEKQLTIQSDGSAFLPLAGLGSVDLGGLTAPEAKKAIETRLHKVYKEVYTELLVLRYSGHRVHLMGEIRTTARTDSGPGEWALAGPTRLVAFLSDHGGPTPEADLMRVQVVRKAGETQEFNLFRAVFHQSEADNPTLQDGDLVFVPNLAMGSRKVFVLGEVNNPGVVTIFDRMNLLEALARAGGVGPRGNEKQIVVIKRHPDGEPDLVTVSLKTIVHTGRLDTDVPLEPGDVVYVAKGALAKVRDVFSIITPALSSIESLYIIDQFRKNR